MTTFSKATSLFALLPLAALLGCSSQADTGYRGEPLATLSGSVVTGTSLAPSSSVSAAIAWAQPKLLFGGASGQTLTDVGYVGESTPVAGTFPASFTLDVFEPPPTASQIPCSTGGATISAGFVVALSKVSASGTIDPNDVLGASNEYLLLYLDKDEPSGWSCLDQMGFTYTTTKGYHLMQVVPDSIQPRAFGASYPAYVEASAGLATSITVTLGTVLPFTPRPSASVDAGSSGGL